jgi:glycosyltransferase involved in cell wall biosynthesis
VNLLFVANFGSDVGYAWQTIDAVYRRVGTALQAHGVRAFICYPDLAPPPTEGATSLVFDYARTGSSPAALLAFLRLLRRHQIRVVYFTDLEGWSWRYPLFHLAGVRRIVVHDRTSGERVRRTGWLGALKRLVHRIPTLAADGYIAVSDYVAERLVAVGAPPARVHRVYNGIDLARFAGGPTTAIHEVLGLPPSTRVVFASGRAQPYKGIDVLIDAAARIEAAGTPDVAVVYCGDGPGLAGFKARAAAQGLRRFHFLGRRDDVPRLLRSATVAVVPSLWAEAFGLTVVEAMAAGVPVVASAVGGIPEIASGILVPPGDAGVLAETLMHLLDAPAERAELVRRARERVQQFSIEGTVAGLVGVLRGWLAV